jgi:hypothetical protein
MTKITKEELKSELIRLSKEECDNSAPTQDDMTNKGKYSFSVYVTRFGGWNKALKECNLGVNRKRNINKDGLVEEIQKVSNEMLNHDLAPTITEVVELGEYSESTYLRYSESWDELLEKAGFDLDDTLGRGGKSIPKDKLISAIHELANSKNKVPTIEDMKEEGRYGRTPYRKQFGGWSNALEKAGFESRDKDVTKDKMIEEINRISNKHCDSKPPKFKLFDEYSDFSVYNSYKIFDGWRDALFEAGFTQQDIYERDKKKYKQILIKIKKEKGRLPTIFDINKNTGVSINPYINIWGSWNEALEAIFDEINKHYDIPKSNIEKEFEEIVQQLGKTPTMKEYNEHSKYNSSAIVSKYGSWTDGVREIGYEPILHVSGENHPYWKENSEKKYYGPGWYSKRKEIRERDNYECRVCGKAQEEQNRKLSVHHIKPQTEFIREGFDPQEDSEIINHEDNLVSLCESCHGKFEAKWQGLSVDGFIEKAQGAMNND